MHETMAVVLFGFAVSDADELRGLMHASLKGFTVEMGVQIAAHLLEEDVVRLCGQKNSRDPHRENCRHGNQLGYVILGSQKVAVRRLRDCGVDTTRPTLFCLDGAKALRAAVKTVFGDNAVVQRCQFHKIRNVESYLSKTHGSEARRRMNEAYTQTHYEDAKRLLDETVTWLQSINRDAASSPRETF